MPSTAAVIGSSPMTIAERDHAGGLGGLVVMVAR